MKRILILVLSIVGFQAYSQVGSASFSGLFTRVSTDSAAYISAASAKHSAGYADWFWNAQASTPHYDIWNGSSYDHIFNFNSGSGGTQDLQDVLTQGAVLTGDNVINTAGNNFYIQDGASSYIGLLSDGAVRLESLSLINLLAVGGSSVNIGDGIKHTVDGTYDLINEMRSNGTGTFNQLKTTNGTAQARVNVDPYTVEAHVKTFGSEATDSTNLYVNNGNFGVDVIKGSDQGSFILSDDQQVSRVEKTGHFTEIVYTDSSATIESTASGFKGLRYLDDYSADFIGHSLVDKNYVDALVGGGGVTPATTGEIAVYNSSTTVDGTTAIPNGITATTQAIHDVTEKVATNKFVKDQTERVYNVEHYGARHDYQTISDASVSSGTPTLTSPSAPFTTNDTGKSIRVFGAGAAGADLLTTMTYVNSTTVTLGTNASTTITTKQIEWGTDDTQAVENTINVVATAGGGTVFLPNGIYFFASALDWHGTGVNSQIYIPVMSTSETKMTIKILGESVIMWPSGPFGAQNLPAKGVIIKSAIVGSGTLPTVFGSATTVVAPIIENICVITKSITGTAHVAPTMSAFILKEAGTKQLKNVIAITESDPTESILPSAVTYGFWMTEIGQTDSHTIYENVTASAYYYGFRFEEHDWWSRVNSYSCLHGFVIAQSAGGGQGHILGGGSGALQSLWCKYGVTFIGDRTIEINYESERWPGSLSPSYWFDFTADFYFPSSQNVTGKISANCENAGGAIVVPVISGTNTGQLNIHDVPNNVTYGAGDMETYSGSGTGRNGLIIKHTNSASQANIYMDNNRGGFASYGGFAMYGSATAGSFLGQTRADKLMLFADGADNTGMAVGTLSNTPFVIGTNNATRFMIGAAGQLGIGGATYGTAGQVLTSGGAGAPPTWGSGGSGWAVTGTTTLTGATAIEGAQTLTFGNATPLTSINSQTSGAQTYASSAGAVSLTSGTTTDGIILQGNAGASSLKTKAASIVISGLTSGTASVNNSFKIQHDITGTPANGVGVGMQFETETSSANYEVGGQIEAVTTDVTGASEDFDLVFKNMTAGAAATEKLRITSTGSVLVKHGSTGSFQLNGLVTPIIESGTTLTLNDDDHRGKIIYFTNSSAITVTVPSGLPLGFTCTIAQVHATGDITLSASGTTIIGKTATTGLGDSIALHYYQSSENYMGF